MFNIASADYISVSVEETVFTSNQTVNDIQCIPITILDDINVLEDTESFEITLSTMDTFIIIRSTQDNIIININEDPVDGSFKFLSCGSQPKVHK
jgi:hypothetical protein